MTVVPVRLEGELTIELENLPQMALEQIKSALTVENEEREKAATLKQFGWWDLPETIPLWRVEDRRSGEKVICIPRGFGPNLIAGLNGMGLEIQLDDQRSTAAAQDGYFKPILLRGYQHEAVLDMLRIQQGFYKAPAGAGKTQAVLGAMAYANQRALVITNKAALAEQWRTRAASLFDFPMERDDKGRLHAVIKGDRCPGLIGQNTWEERDLTVCLSQTLHSRIDYLDAQQWWRKWGFVVIDEGHGAAAETLGEVSRRLSMYYFMAASATPAKSETRGKIVHALIGPIIHETPRERLYAEGVLMKPTVEIDNGDFDEVFWPDHDAEFDKVDQRWKCQVPDCKKNNKHGHRNNYSSVQSKLVKDEPRNARIVKRIMEDRGHYHLVPARQKGILDALRKMIIEAGWPKEKVWYLRGEENAAGLSEQIKDEIMQSDEAVLLSTVADEGLDIPPLDRIHLVFPMRQEAATIQVVGRVERIWEGKDDAVVLDYADPKCECFRIQLEERLRTYRMQGYTITGIEVPEAVAV